MFVKIDLYSGESTIVDDSSVLREHLNSINYVEGAIKTWLDEEYMIIQIQEQNDAWYS
jgi:hypothetical protein